jgi:2-dehydropantoate 2-reductase
VDVVLFTVKLWDTELAAQSMMPLLGPDTRIITLQNGIDSVDLISRWVPAKRIVAGVIYVSVVVAEPGMIRSPGGTCRLLVDHANGDEVVAGFVAACGGQTGIEIHTTSSIQTTVWEKFIGLCASSGSTLLRSTMGPILANTETRAFVLQLVEEGAAIAQAAAIQVRDDVVKATMALLASVPPNFRASMAEDLLRGRRLELNWFAGRMHALGLRYSIPTPAQTAVYRGLLLHANGVQRSSLLA